MINAVEITRLVDESGECGVKYSFLAELLKMVKCRMYQDLQCNTVYQLIIAVDVVYVGKCGVTQFSRTSVTETPFERRIVRRIFLHLAFGKLCFVVLR
jgi:hypothetical protein